MKRNRMRLAALLAVAVLCVALLAVSVSASVPTEGYYIEPNTEEGSGYIRLYENGEEVSEFNGGGEWYFVLEYEGEAIREDILDIAPNSIDFFEVFEGGELLEGYGVADGVTLNFYLCDEMDFERTNTLEYIAGEGFRAAGDGESSETIGGESTDTGNDGSDGHMSMYKISRAFLVFFLDGADPSIIDWFACVLTLALAGGLVSMIIAPIRALIRGKK